jgi:hypothetical protein
VLLRDVARELGYELREEQLRPLSDQIVDELFRLKPQALCGDELKHHYFKIAKRVLRKQLSSGGRRVRLAPSSFAD